MDRTLALEGCETVSPDESRRADAIGRLFDLYHARLYKLALRMTWGDDDAHDLVQECFLRALEHRLPDDPVIVERWLVRVMVNLCLDRRRRGAVRRDHARRMSREAPVTSPDQEMGAALRDAVLGLPVRQRAVVVLHEIEGRTLQEVAGMLGVAAVTARWHLHVALRTLRKELSR